MARISDGWLATTLTDRSPFRADIPRHKVELTFIADLGQTFTIEI